MQNSRQAYVNLALATAAFTVSSAAWSLILPLSRQIPAELHLGNSGTALLIAVPMLMGALIRIPMGIVTDLFGGRKVFTGLLLFTLLPVAFLGFAHSFWSYIAGAFLLGTAGASFAIGIPFVSRWFTPDRAGTALGIYGVGNIGVAATVFAIVPLTGLFGGRGAIWFYLMPVTVMAIVFWLFARDAPGLVAQQPIVSSLVSVGRQRRTWHLALFYFVTFGGFVSFASYLPQFLGDWLPPDRRDAGLQAAIFTLGATVARPLGGWLSDQLGGGTILIGVFACVVAARLALAWQAESANIVIIADLLFIISLVFGIGNGAVFKLVAQYFPKNTGLAAGVVGAAGGIGGFFPPAVLGAIRESTGSYALAFVIFATLAGFCLALLLAGPQKSPVPAIAGVRFGNGRRNSDVHERLTSFLFLRDGTRKEDEDATARLARAKSDARSIIAFVQGHDTEELTELNRFDNGR